MKHIPCFAPKTFTLFAVLLLCSICSVFSFAADDTLAPTARDIASLSKASDVRISPDGSKVIYLLTSYSFDEDATWSEDDEEGGWTKEKQLYMVNRDGTGLQQLTSGNSFPSHPRWSKDGTRVAFLKKNQGKKRIYILPLNGEKAWWIDTGELEPTSFEWSPEGRMFAFTAEIPKTEVEKENGWKNAGVYEFGTEFPMERLYMVYIDDSLPITVTSDDEHVVDFDWSPDTRNFAVVVSESGDPYDATLSQVPKIVNAQSGLDVKILEETPGIFEGIQWSPDGQYVSYLKGENTLSLMNTLVVHELEGENKLNAAEQLDPTIYNYSWTHDSKGLYAHIIEKTKSILYLLSRDGKTFQDLGYKGREFHNDLVLDSSGRYLVCQSSTWRNPPNPTIVDLKDGKKRFRTLVDINPHDKDWPVGNLETVRWTNSEGIEIEGLLLHTPGYTPGTPEPMLVLPHGGPDGVDRESWSRWSVYFASRGYAVFRPNYRGGLGYGREFYAANRGRLGEIEWIDIESGINLLVDEDKADPEKLVIGGWSWGGYITAWAISHTDKFKAAVIGAGEVDAVSNYAHSDVNRGIAAEWEFKGNPWEQTETFDRSSPFRYLKNATTPTLIFHGENDKRIPFGQGVMLYRALSDVGCEVKFYVYPDEPHSFRKPAHTEHYLKEWGDWLDRYTAGQ